MRKEIQQYFEDLQDFICSSLELEDGGNSFHQDIWEHHSGGGGRTRILMHGNVIEKGGVNFSATWGKLSENMAKRMNVPAVGYFATGVSIVIHAFNPFVPTIHMNVRYFELENGKYWFGGGIDLTPMYVIIEDGVRFHTGLKAVCDGHNSEYYPKFKQWADEYFYLPHRKEMRGIGGIFFDYMAENEKYSKKDIFAFVQSVGNFFAPFYTQTMALRKNTPFTQQHKDFQLWRRGRYVEFNLIYDRGTLFGLDNQGRTESILMSLPYEVRWLYNYQPEPNSQEAFTLEYLQPKDWISLSQVKV
ncbi:MAG: oxygen-dependent coproporphyrinogen oxidase [Bacteroidia bacterium]|nr:oxygen-dependent coproporphyrinogen oxidase [Bacteroidia bacterium]MDW8345939.1 oxygen-dependent coproporphyrinogen oxidase [Bacteroidia bacterium]